MSNLLRLFLALGLTFSLSGCAQAPQQDIDSAKAVIEEARTAQADKYAPESFQQAEDALQSAMAEIEAQNGKFAMFRSYERATELLAQAKETGTKAKADGEAKRSEARQAAEALIKEAEIALDAAKTSLTTAPRGKGTRADIEAMKAEIETLSSTLTEAHQAFDSGDFLSAKAKADSVKAQAGQISSDIQQARAKKAT